MERMPGMGDIDKYGAKMVYWGQIRLDKPKFGQIMTILYFIFGQLLM